jgi:hypothetical protein
VTKRRPDPGWRPVVGLLPKMFIPFIGMRSMATQPSALVALRMLSLYVVVAIVPVWAVAIVVVANPNRSRSVGVPVVLAAAAGVVSLVVVRMLAARVSYSSARAFAHSFPRNTMFQLGASVAAALVGFVMTVLSGSLWPYTVGFAFTFVGLAISIPTAARLEREQEAANETGSAIDVVTALVDHQLFR